MAWSVLYYREVDGRVPVEEFLDGCPMKVEATILAVLDAVAEAPPPQYSGGGKWEAMHGEMGGFYEVRVTGPGREQFRVFCVLENAEPEVLRKHGLGGPAIVAVNGMRKKSGTVFSQRDYSKVKRMGEDYLRTKPRRFAVP